MSMGKEEIALNITLKPIENGLVLALRKPENESSEVNSNTAASVGEFYNTILNTIKPYER